MKIAYILNSSKALGGASKAFKTMLYGLMQQGVEPIVVMPGKGQLYDELSHQGIKCHATTYRANTFPRANSLKDIILFFPRLFARRITDRLARRAVLQWLKSEHVELIHSNSGVVDIGFHVSRALRIPHVYHIREYADLDFGYHYYPSKLSFRRQLDAKQSYSICITKDIQRHHGQNKSSRSRVIYDGIRPAIDSMPQAKPEDYFLFAGRIETTKGLDILLKAYALNQRKGLTLLPLKVAGRVSEPDYYATILQFLKDNGLEEVVTLLGECSDINTLMSQARALVVPSRHEGFGLCMPEAMFNGCLVLAHDTAGTHEQLENGKALMGSDIALRFNSSEQLAELLDQVTNASADEYAPMVRKAFDTVNQLYTTEKHIRQVYDFYNDIIKETQSK